MIARQSILLKAAQKTQSALDSQHYPPYTDYPINLYVLYTAPTKAYTVKKLVRLGLKTAAVLSTFLNRRS